MRGSVLRGLLFGPSHLNSPMMLRAAAAAAATAASSAAHRSFPLSSVGIIVIVRADAGQPQHGVAVFHQLGLVRTHKHVFSRLSSVVFFSLLCVASLLHSAVLFPNSLHLSLSLSLSVPVCLCFLWRCVSCGLQYSCT